MFRRLRVFRPPEIIFSTLFSQHAPSFWLDSSRAEPGLARFSFIGTVEGEDGFWISYDARQKRLTVRGGAGACVADGDLFEYLNGELARRRCGPFDLPFNFNGGFVGYIGYEMKAACGSSLYHVSTAPDACLMFIDHFVAFDHFEKMMYLVALAKEENGADAEPWFDRMEREILDAPVELPPCSMIGEGLCLQLEQPTSLYLRNIAACMKLIRDGESYEVCLTNRLRGTTTLSPLDYYRVLRSINPAPYSAFLKFPDLEVACSSPERFLKVDCLGVVESKPIKGTIARGQTSEQDAILRRQLENDVKNRSENLMIVDLLRNDLGRVCEIGSVTVTALMQVESYATVHQLVSTVRGTLRKTVSAVDCVRASFPGGSMTGAPKLRTMEIIDHLESSARGIYSGTIGYFALNGSSDLNIVIRTACFSKNTVTIGAGGAIVALSDPVAECDEVFLKLKAPVDAFRSLVRSVKCDIGATTPAAASIA